MVSHFKGSRDTADKLDRLQSYLEAYSTALKNQNFALIYIDAFAGSGTRVETRAALPLFNGGSIQPEVVHTPGSAKIALSIEPPFNVLTFIEADAGRFAELEKLKLEHQHRAIALYNGDANAAVKRICARVPWHERKHDLAGMRGVIFLDPYGMEVEWATVEAIARTRALDCWYLFPLSGLYRNAPHNPAKLDEAKQASLDRVLGTTDWRTEWYRSTAQPRDMLESVQEACEGFPVQRDLAGPFRAAATLACKPRVLLDAHSFKASGHPHRIAVGATGRQNSAASDWIPRRVRPFNRCFGHFEGPPRHLQLASPR